VAKFAHKAMPPAQNFIRWRKKEFDPRNTRKNTEKKVGEANSSRIGARRLTKKMRRAAAFRVFRVFRESKQKRASRIRNARQKSQNP
jgi:hypothetical protein